MTNWGQSIGSDSRVILRLLQLRVIDLFEPLTQVPFYLSSG